MTDELVTRLRNGCSCNLDSTPCAAESECRDAIEAADRIEADAATIARLEEELGISRQSERHSHDWANAAIDDMRAAEAKLAQAVEVMRGVLAIAERNERGVATDRARARAFLDSMGGEAGK